MATVTALTAAKTLALVKAAQDAADAALSRKDTSVTPVDNGNGTVTLTVPEAG